MDVNSETKRLMTRFLLGEMSEEERSEFEGQYLENPDLFEELIALEDQMMRSYATGDGSEAERKAFEKRFLHSDAGRQRVDFARSLMNYVASTREATGSRQVAETPVSAKLRYKRRIWQRQARFLGLLPRQIQFAAVAAMIVLIVGGSWLVVTEIRLRHALDQAQLQHAAQEKELRDQVADLKLRLQHQEQQVAQLSALGSAILPFMLPSHFIREPNLQKLLIIPETFSAVFLVATLQSNDYPTYSVALETPEGRVIWRQSGLKSWATRDGSYAIGLILPANIFTSGNYILDISARTAGKLEEVESYSFHVVRK